MALEINKEFEELIPYLTDDEYERLEQSIIDEGCRHPVITWRGVVIDGHHRRKICKKHKLPFKTEEMDFPDKEAVVQWMVKNQLSRRNLSDQHRVELAEKLTPELKKKAKEQQIRKPESVLAKLPKQEPVNTRKAVADASGVSDRKVGMIKFVKKHAAAAPHIYDAMMKEVDGDGKKMSAYRAYREMKSIVSAGAGKASESLSELDKQIKALTGRISSLRCDLLEFRDHIKNIESSDVLNAFGSEACGLCETLTDVCKGFKK